MIWNSVALGPDRTHSNPDSSTKPEHWTQAIRTPPKSMNFESAWPEISWAQTHVLICSMSKRCNIPFHLFFLFFYNIGQARFVKKISNFATLLHNALIIGILIFWAGFFYKISTTFSAKDTKYGPYHLKQHKWRVCIF